MLYIYVCLSVCLSVSLSQPVSLRALDDNGLKSTYFSIYFFFLKSSFKIETNIFCLGILFPFKIVSV